MNILIATSYNTFLTVTPEHTAALVALLPHVRVVDASGYGDSLTYAIKPMPLAIEFIDSAKLAPMNLREQELKDLFEKKNTELANAYTANEANKKRVDELEQRIAKLTGMAIDD